MFGGDLTRLAILNAIEPIKPIFPYRETVGESSRLGSGRQSDRRSKASLHGLHGLKGCTAPESLMKVKSEAAGSHCKRNRWDGEGGGGEERGAEAGLR